MPIPTWVSGQVLTASDVNSWFVSLAVVKPSDQSVTSSTTLVNDSALVLSFAANSTYTWLCRLKYTGGTRNASDLKWTWVPPGGSTTDYSALVNGVGTGTPSWDDRSGLDVLNAATNGGTSMTVAMWGTTATVGAGTMQLQWAQNTSNGTATIVKAQSTFYALKVG